MDYIRTPGYYAWCGNAFEMVVWHHVHKVKEALGISGVQTREYTWRSQKKQGGAQIDLVIDRKDDIIDLCEIRFTMDPFVISSDYARDLYHKMEVFREETKTQKAVHLILIFASGMVRNAHSACVQQVITGDMLF